MFFYTKEHNYNGSVQDRLTIIACSVAVYWNVISVMPYVQKTIENAPELAYSVGLMMAPLIFVAYKAGSIAGHKLAFKPPFFQIVSK